MLHYIVLIILLSYAAPFLYCSTLRRVYLSHVALPHGTFTFVCIYMHIYIYMYTYIEQIISQYAELNRIIAYKAVSFQIIYVLRYQKYADKTNQGIVC